MITPKQIAWVIDNRKRQEATLAKINSPETRNELRMKYYVKNQTRRYWYVDRCRAYLDSISGNPERCINYTLIYNGQYYVHLDWAAKINLPNRCYWQDSTTCWLALTPFGINWVLDFLLHRNRILVVRKSTLVDRKGEAEINKIV